MKPHCTALATALAATLTALAGVPLEWSVTPNTIAPLTVYRLHGETLNFSCRFKGFGELPFAQGADIRLWYQTNGMGSAWWSLPATVSSNVISATFPPQANPGADHLALFFGAPSNVYASAVLRLRPSPGCTPNVLPPPDTMIWATELAAVRALVDYSPSNAALIATIEATSADCVRTADLERFASTGTVKKARSSTSASIADYSTQADAANFAYNLYNTSDWSSWDVSAILTEGTNAAKKVSAETVYDVHDLRWDEEEQILYWCKFVGGHDLCIAVTNINLTHPTNAVLLKKWREDNR